jgi:lipopolysaccharide export system ATP-binding protein
MDARTEPATPTLQTEGDGLRALNLAKAFKGRQVVKDVSLSLRRGEIAGLLGPNGAGKTTCFYMVMGLIQADAGRVLIDGEDVTHLPMYQRARLGVGYLPQENSIFRGMSVWDNIMAVAELSEDVPAKRKALTDSLLEELQITRLARQNANSLSGGESRSPGRSPRGPASSCSTSRSPALIPLPYPTSRISFGISRAGVLAC